MYEYPLPTPHVLTDWMVCEGPEPANYHKAPRLQDDLLWKAVLEDLIEDFLRFFIPDADERFDFNRGFEYMDKELEQLHSPETGQFSPLHVDKLVKVFTNEAPGEWVLLHIEVQGYSQKEFPARMFRYFTGYSIIIAGRSLPLPSSLEVQ